VSSKNSGGETLVASHGTHEGQPLVIDLAAAADTPGPGAIREWARNTRVFVSCLARELAAERHAAAAAVGAIGAWPATCEQLGGTTPEDACLSEVETSEVYVGILGRLYGRPLPSGLSVPHAEYRHAENRGLRIAVWSLATRDREDAERALLDEIRRFELVSEFTSPEDLHAQVKNRLRAIAAEDLLPWCKLGSLVFRATTIDQRGNTLTVAARIHSDEVARALAAFAGPRSGREHDARFTWQGRSRSVRVRSVESARRWTRSRVMRLGLEVIDEPHGDGAGIRTGDLGPADLTDVALRAALFRDPDALSDKRLGFFSEIPDPLQALREARVSDDIVRLVAGLLVVDALVGSNLAVRVTAFRLGDPIGDARPALLSWLAPQRYSGERTVTRTIKGWVRI
jgi:hypothetical protein